MIAILALLGAAPDLSLAADKSKPVATTAAGADAEPVATTEVAAPTMEERQAVFGEVNDLYKTGRKKEAADRLVAIAQDPANTMFHAEAFARLGAVLKELELPYSALVAYAKALEAQPAAVASEVKKMIALADQVGDTAILEPLLAQNVGLTVDKDTQSRMAYLAARGAHRNQSYATALAILKMVSDKDPDYAEAKALEGVVLSMQGRHKDALAPLLIAESILKQRQQTEEDQRALTAVRLNLARAYYGAENYGRAIEYFVTIPRTSDYWVEAQFERAWAHFRLNDMNGTLALLQTHASPFLVKEYYPEAELLRVYALFMMCKFPEANKEIAAFSEQYQGTLETLRTQESRSSEELFQAMKAAAREEESDLPALVQRPFVHEARFNDRLQAIDSADDEQKRLDKVKENSFATTAAKWVEERKLQLESEEGERIRARVQSMSLQLSEMLNNVEVSKLDIMQMETRLYEQAANLGVMPEPPRKVSRKLRLSKGYLYWPWDGEYWADEVGYYRIDAKPECPAALKVGG